MKIHERIKELRENGKIKLSQQDLAKAISTSQSAIAKWEKEKTQPTAENIIALVKYFNISADYLLGLTEDETPYWDIPLREIKRTQKTLYAARSNDNKTPMKCEILTKEEADRRRKALDDAADKDE